MRSPLDNPDFIALLRGIESPTPDWGRVAIIADWCEEQGYDSWSVVFRLVIKWQAWPSQSNEAVSRWMWGNSLPWFIHSVTWKRFDTWYDTWLYLHNSYTGIIESLTP